MGPNEVAENGVDSILDSHKLIKTPAIFCGANAGADPLFVQHADELGKLLGEKGLTIVYGGASCGIMGTVADSVMAAGGKAIGVMPQSLFGEVVHEGLSELIYTPDMSTRKDIMYTKSDSVIILPGGIGTLDEFFEILSLVLIRVHDKLIFILNSNNFYTHIIQHLKHMESNGFLHDMGRLHQKLVVLTEPNDIIPYLATVQ